MRDSSQGPNTAANGHAGPSNGTATTSNGGGAGAAGVGGTATKRVSLVDKNVALLYVLTFSLSLHPVLQPAKEELFPRSSAHTFLPKFIFVDVTLPVTAPCPLKTTRPTTIPPPTRMTAAPTMKHFPTAIFPEPPFFLSPTEVTNSRASLPIPAEEG
jgi:hypothetical protein